MKYFIQNENGQYWTGKGWGAKEARKVFTKKGLPVFVEDKKGEKQGFWVNSWCCPCDAGYGEETFARVYPVDILQVFGRI